MRSVFGPLVCTLALATATSAQTNPFEVRRAARPIPGQYIVVVAPAEDPDALGSEMANRFNGRLRHIYRSALRGFAIGLPAPAAAALARDPRVRFVEEDATFEAQQVQATPPWGLDRLDQRALPLDQSYFYGTSPRQVTVHVLDSGVRPTHTEFAGRAFIAADYVDDDRDGDPQDIANDDADTTRADGADCHGHGTHVAGTIAGITTGVAKYAVVMSHRVLGCDGSGSLSAILAAVDAVTADPGRPAVANMSLGGGASSALDSAVRTSIAAGVTYVVAAGNDNVDASTRSPARVAEAITVGATTSTDARASFSNYGSSLDLFAPGASILSAGHTGDTATKLMSGTSMATPHVAGVAAMYLERNPASSPAQVRNALVAAASQGVVSGAGTGSPNVLLYSGFLHGSVPSVTLARPDGGERLFTGTPFTIEWQASDPEGIASVDVLVSADNGATFNPIAECSGLPGTARACRWNAPGPVTSYGRIKVVATDTAGSKGSDLSLTAFQVLSGPAVITVTAPNTAVNWGRQSTQQIKWTHNLGVNSYVRIEASRDGGVTFPETIVSALKHTSSTSGVYNWTVTGPNAAGALIRISWTAGPASDVSNVGFTIAEPFITVSSPTYASSWGYETLQRVGWMTNLGALDRVAVMLSTDGVTYPTSLATNVAATANAANVTTPVLGAATTAAQVRVTWTNAPSGAAAVATTSAAFKIGPAFVTVTAPNGGETWTSGYSGTIRWTGNLGKQESVQIQLSKDGGMTWPITLTASTKDDGSHGVLVDPSWITGAARIRLAWVRKPPIADTSNANFTIR